MEKTYLGEGVYAAFSGGCVVLTAENGIEATDTIVLEPEVYVELVEFVEILRNKPQPGVSDSELE